ncbi:hypothetical protein [Brevundimonas diminuta]|uniref:hypothetical protein n=1 Tax=Brevundimonas diminuta TaxID=293 RepID=UPI003D9A9C12
MTGPIEPKGEAEAELSVIDRVLSAFTDAVAATEGLEDVSERLAETLISKKDLSEAALHRALFDADQA